MRICTYDVGYIPSNAPFGFGPQRVPLGPRTLLLDALAEANSPEDGGRWAS